MAYAAFNQEPLSYSVSTSDVFQVLNKDQLLRLAMMNAKEQKAIAEILRQNLETAMTKKIDQALKEAARNTFNPKVEAETEPKPE